MYTVYDFVLFVLVFLSCPFLSTLVEYGGKDGDKMDYFLKNANSFNSSYSGMFYEKPSICPHCGYGTDAPYEHKHVLSFNGNLLLCGEVKCTSCGKNFYFICESNKDRTRAPLAYVYPSLSATEYSNEYLANISERFIDIYNQAIRAEFTGDIELAAIGYRASLEILVKDYAIKELGEPKNIVAEKSLYTAIKDYLKQEDLINTADVIRILGNDYAHYERKYPQHDFELLKAYMEIFLKQIEVSYMVKHPPVSRQSPK